MDDRGVPKNTRPVFQRTTTIGGLTVTSPSDWTIVDYWGEWTPDSHISWDDTAIPVLEMTNFDPGLSTPVCDVASGERTRLPADGVAIFVIVGNDGRKAADLCGGSVDASVTATISGYPYRSVMTVGPNVTEKTRATAERIWRSLEWTSFYSYNREQAPAYVLDGWPDEREGVDWLVEARPSERGVELYEIAPYSHYGDAADVVPRRSSGIQGKTVGVVTEDAARVEHRRGGVDTPLVARLLDLPPSLASGFDAYVFESQPTGESFEVVAIGTDGEVLGSKLPPLVNTAQVGTVRAFGATWIVKVSTAADGYWASTCVEPATITTRAPCERGPGGGVLVQSWDGLVPAVFVTQPVGDIVGVDVIADDGTTFRAVMLPIPSGGFRGGEVAVVAIEGGGKGRFVYHLRDGRVDQGRRPEAHVEWPDLGQVIGDGSFAPPGTT
jgi:hypothetical protein